MLSYLYPENYTPFFSPFFLIKRYKEIIFKLLTLNTNYVIKKISVVRTAYFYPSGPIFEVKKIVTESVTQSKKFFEDILASLDQENVGWKMVYNFLGKDEKTQRNSYLLLLKTSVWKEVHHFSVQCILTETT